MKNQALVRKQQDFTSNGKLVFTMPLTGKVKVAHVILDGSVTIGAGSGADGTAVIAEAPIAGLIKRIRVRTAAAPGSKYVNTAGVIWDLSPRSLLWLAAKQRDCGRFLQDTSATPVTTGGVATKTVHLDIPLHFADFRKRRPIETALNVDADAHQLYQIEVDLGLWTDAFVGSTRTFDYSALKVQVFDERESVAGDTYVVNCDEHDFNGWSVAVTDREDKNLWVDGGMVDIFMMAKDGGVLVDTILQKIKVNGDTYESEDIYERDLRQMLVDDGVLNVAETRTGIYDLDFQRDGLITKTVNAAGLRIKFDCAAPSGDGTDTITMIGRRLFMPPGMVPIGSKSARNQ